MKIDPVVYMIRCCAFLSAAKWVSIYIEDGDMTLVYKGNGTTQSKERLVLRAEECTSTWAHSENPFSTYIWVLFCFEGPGRQ